MLREIGSRLLARHDAIGAEIVARMVDEIPEYRRAPEDVLEDVAALATETTRLLASALASGTALDRAYVPIVRDQAARRVHQGISLDVFLHAYRVALFAFWDECVAEAERLNATREEGFEVARFTLDAIDTMTTHAAEAYLREETRLRAQSGRIARDLVERLLRGDRVDPRAIPALDLGGRLTVAVGRGDAEALSGRGRLVAEREDEVVVIAARRPEFPPGAHFGVGSGVDIPRAYREASLALSYATDARPVVSLEDLSALECALLGTDAATRAVISARAQLDEADARLIQTFADTDLSVARTAAQLDVHQNTVRYRLQRIADATGFDPRTFSGLVELTCSQLV